MEKLDSSIRINGIEIFSFLLKEGKIVDSIESVEANPSNFFWSIGDIDPGELKSHLNNQDFHLEGGIHFSYYGKEVLGYRHWDLVDQLWAYLLSAVCRIEVEKEKSTSFSFPDQPIDIQLKDTGRSIIFSIDKNTFEFPRKDFINSILMGASQFFNALDQSAVYSEQLDQIEKLRTRK